MTYVSIGTNLEACSSLVRTFFQVVISDSVELFYDSGCQVSHAWTLGVRAGADAGKAASLALQQVRILLTQAIPILLHYSHLRLSSLRFFFSVSAAETKVVLFAVSYCDSSAPINTLLRNTPAFGLCSTDHDILSHPSP
jgi:hypothetical protein